MCVLRLFDGSCTSTCSRRLQCILPYWTRKVYLCTYSNLGISTFLTTHYFTGAKSTLIAAIEGGDGPTKDLYLVGTVNKKWLLDEAFLSRAVQFYVPLPSQDQIEAQISYTIAKEQDEADLVKWDVKEKGIERLGEVHVGKTLFR